MCACRRVDLLQIPPPMSPPPHRCRNKRDNRFTTRVDQRVSSRRLRDTAACSLMTRVAGAVGDEDAV